MNPPLTVIQGSKPAPLRWHPSMGAPKPDVDYLNIETPREVVERRLRAVQ